MWKSHIFLRKSHFFLWEASETWNSGILEFGLRGFGDFAHSAHQARRTIKNEIKKTLKISLITNKSKISKWKKERENKRL